MHLSAFLLLPLSSLAILTSANPQAYGSPKWQCHNNCGNAVTIVKSNPPNLCTNGTFIDLYQQCISCVEENNGEFADVWQYYGRRLSEDKIEACRLKPDSVVVTKEVPVNMTNGTGTTTSYSYTTNSTSSGERMEVGSRIKGIGMIMAALHMVLVLAGTWAL